MIQLLESFKCAWKILGTWIHSLAIYFMKSQCRSSTFDQNLVSELNGTWSINVKYIPDFEDSKKARMWTISLIII